MTDRSGWEDILDDGEIITWQGRPDGKIAWKLSHIFTILFGIAFSGFAVFWMVMASQAGGIFWMFGLIHFFAGIAVGIGPPLWAAWSRRHTWYSLSNKRAFIATDIPFQGRNLKIYPIDAKTKVTLNHGNPASVYFANEYRSTKNGSREILIGFERIEGADTVSRLLRDIQTGAL